MVVWGYHSNWDDLNAFVKFMLSGDFIRSPVLSPVIVISLYLLYTVLGRVILAVRFGIRLGDYVPHTFLGMAVGFYAMFPLLGGLASVLFSRPVSFPITKKRGIKPSFMQILTQMRYTLILIIFLVIGIFLNPLALAFHWFWIVPLFLSPLILYWGHHWVSARKTAIDTGGLAR